MVHRESTLRGYVVRQRTTEFSAAYLLNKKRAKYSDPPRGKISEATHPSLDRVLFVAFPAGSQRVGDILVPRDVDKGNPPRVHNQCGFEKLRDLRRCCDLYIEFGLLKVQSEGQILYKGRSIYEDLVAFQSRIGNVPEEGYLYPHLSGREYLQLVGCLRGMPQKELDPKMDELLRLFSLWEDRYTSLSSYSKGMRQKILLSAALLHNPEILILDEPFSGLDVNSALMLRRLLAGLAERGKIILYSSHVLEVVEKVCSKVLILRKGEVVAYNSIDHLRELMQQPSLEGVFAQLTNIKDDTSLADRILDVVTSDKDKPSSSSGIFNSHQMSGAGGSQQRGGMFK